MRRFIVAAIIGGLFLSCASATDTGPTPLRPRIYCHVSCPEGVLFQAQHICRGDRTRFQDIPVTGEDVNPLDSHQDRWLTGLTSYGAQVLAQERLAAEGANPDSPDYGRRYAATLKKISSELGELSRAAYPKDEVVTQPCSTYISSRIASRSAQERGQYPGEDDHGRPTTPPN